jgi:hypothetical protein
MEPLRLGLPAPAGRPDILRAESLLHEIALALLRVPLRGPTRDMHLRALRLKKRVSAWPPDVAESTVQATIQELVALHRCAFERGGTRADGSSC